MGSIGSWMSPSVRMTAASGIGRQLATWLSCARWPSTSSVTAEQPRSACGRVASRLPGMMSTCCLYWLDDFMRRPWGAADCARRLGEGARHVTKASTRLRSIGLIVKEWSGDEGGTVIEISAQPSACIVARRNGAGKILQSASSPALSVLTLYAPLVLSALIPVRLSCPMWADAGGWHPSQALI